ncbi:MAG: hypothetical protein ACSLFK_07550 [Gemmatimonadaceae bacterium]
MRSTAISCKLFLLLSSASIAATANAQGNLPGRVTDIKVGEYFITAPDSIAAGIVTLRVTQTGDVAKPWPPDMVKLRADPTYYFHMVWLVRLDSAKTIADYYNAVRDSAPAPWATIVGGAGFAEAPGSSNVSLIVPPGNYALVCHVGSARPNRDRYHMLKGMFRSLKVVGASGTERLPVPTLTVVLSGDSLVMPDTISAGEYRILVQNMRARRSDFEINRLKLGFTIAQLRAWRANQLTEPPKHSVGGVVGITPNGSLLTSVVLDRGDYFFGEKHVVVR